MGNLCSREQQTTGGGTMAFDEDITCSYFVCMSVLLVRWFLLAFVSLAVLADLRLCVKY